MPTKSNLPQAKPQDRAKHPPHIERELSPGIAAVRTRGTAEATEPKTRPASELKDLVRVLRDFTSDELRQIRVVVPGSRLAPGATYLDVRAPSGGPFVAPEESHAGKDSWFVPKADVTPPLWNRLLRTEGAGSLAREGVTRHVQTGSPELRGGRERSERRGGTATSSVRSPARQHRARGH
jgi:hypothetical protein